MMQTASRTAEGLEVTEPVQVIEAMLPDRPSPVLAALLAARAEIMALSQASHDAVLTPAEPGGLSYGERAAFATRMALQNNDQRLATHYGALLDAAAPSDAVRLCADPTVYDGFGSRLSAMVRHVDLLTRQPSAATRSDVDALRFAGIEEADIVRLVELVAFVNYQVRVIAGLSLLQAAQ